MSRWLAHSVVAPALASMVFAAVEILRLHSGHYRVPATESAALLGLHALLGAGVGVGVASLGLLWPAARRGRLRGLATAAPTAAVLFLLVGLAVNVLYLPSFTRPSSVLATLGLLIAAAALALLVGRLRWPSSVPRLLLGGSLALCVGSLLLAARGGGASRPFRTGVTPGGAPTVIVALIDTLRADHLGAYGYPQPTSPTIDRLASEGVVFDAAYSASNWTRPAVASLFTSTLPSRHGAIEATRRVSADMPMLADSLSAAGYAVGCFTSGVNVEAADGYGRSVDRFFSARSRPAILTTFYWTHLLQPMVALLPGDPLGSWRPSAQVDPARVTDAALQWIGSVPARRPLFAYLHYHGPHAPYDPPAELALPFSDRAPVPRLAEHPESWAGATALPATDRRQLIAQYDGEILWHDREIARLLEGLDEAGRLADSVLIVTADHGEGFGEHGVWAHGQSLFREITRIPLVVWAPSRFAPSRQAAPVSLIDLAPTVLDVARARIPASFDGGSLEPWLRGDGSAERTVFFENPARDEAGLRTARWVYFEGRTPSGPRRWLFAAEDERQGTDLAPALPDIADRLSSLVAARRRADSSRSVAAEHVELDAERIEELKALGYLQ